MLKFLDKIEDRIAFKRAVNELDEENKIKTGTVTRVYHNNSLNIKKETPVVDILTGSEVDVNYFKEWHDDVVLEPGNHETIIDDFDKFNEDRIREKNEAVQVIKNQSHDNDKSQEKTQEEASSAGYKSFIDMLDAKNNLKPSEGRTFDYKSFIKNRNNDVDKNEAFEDNIGSNVMTRDGRIGKVSLSDRNNDINNKIVSERNEISEKLDQIISSLNSKINEKSDDGSVVAKVDPQSEEVHAPAPIKVVKRTSSATATKRKTRGKGKRKFDKDVVKFIDWRE